MLTIACVQTNNYCGRGWEYVERLYIGVKANLSVPFNFCCFTDDHNPPQTILGLTGPVVSLRVARHEGWWEKLRIFEDRNYSPETTQVLFFDLDTIILDDITHYAKVHWRFATLRDFWRPTGIGPAVMFFDPSAMSWIYKQWRGESFPKRGNGDQAYLQNLDQGRFAKKATKLQDIYPGEFISYKAHVEEGTPRSRGRGNGEIPPGAKVLCFHGRPRPHEVGWLGL